MALSSLEQSIRDFIEGIIAEEYPEFSLKAGEPFNDLFVGPMIEVLKPIFINLERIDAVQNLDNASRMTAEELNQFGSGNYGVVRAVGTAASGTVYVEVNNRFVANRPVYINPIVVCKHGTTYKFASELPTFIRYTAADTPYLDAEIASGLVSDYLNLSTGNYEFPVFVTATGLGSAYNCGIGEIDTIEVTYPMLTGVITNRAAIDNGTDSESNISYARRLRRYISSKNTGTNKWYRNYILNTFDNVVDVYVAGYGNELMERDKIIIRSNGSIEQVHQGGKVDLYIRGSYPATYTQTQYINSSKFRLAFPDLKDETSISITNLTHAGYNIVDMTFEYEIPASKTGWCAVTFTDAYALSPVIGDLLEIKYINLVDPGTEMETSYLRTEYMYYKSPKIRISKQPFNAISALTNDTKGVEVDFDTVTSSRVPLIKQYGRLPDQTSMGTHQIKLDPYDSLVTPSYYEGSTLEITAGTGYGGSAVISSYDGDTKIATVGTIISPHPDDTSSYKIYDAYDPEIVRSAKDQVDLTMDLTPYIMVEANAWSGTTAYATGTIVWYSDITYKAKSNFTSGTTPDADTVHWEVYHNTNNVWLSTRTYAINDHVWYQGWYYKCAIGNSANTPGFSSSYWLREKCIDSGDLISLTYSYNNLVYAIQDHIDIEAVRVITTDVLVKEANPTYINIGIELKCKYGKYITQANKDLISNFFSDYFDTRGFGTTLELSDLVSLIYLEPEIALFLDYIQFPIIFYKSDTIFTSDDEDDIFLLGDTYKNSRITMVDVEYPVLGTLVVKEL